MTTFVVGSKPFSDFPDASFSSAYSANGALAHLDRFDEALTNLNAVLTPLIFAGRGRRTQEQAGHQSAVRKIVQELNHVRVIVRPCPWRYRWIVRRRMMSAGIDLARSRFMSEQEVAGMTSTVVNGGARVDQFNNLEAGATSLNRVYPKVSTGVLALLVAIEECGSQGAPYYLWGVGADDSPHFHEPFHQTKRMHLSEDIFVLASALQRYGKDRIVIGDEQLEELASRPGLSK